MPSGTLIYFCHTQAINIYVHRVSTVCKLCSIIKVQRDARNLNVRIQDKIKERLVSTFEHMHAYTKVRTRCPEEWRPLLEYHTRCKCSIETSRN